MINPTFWAVTKPLGLNNPIAGFLHILASAGLYLTHYFFECRKTYGFALANLQCKNVNARGLATAQLAHVSLQDVC